MNSNISLTDVPRTPSPIRDISQLKAPMAPLKPKPVFNPYTIDPSVCRKLEFK